MYDILRTIEFLVAIYQKMKMFHETAMLVQEIGQEENDLGHGSNCYKTIRK